MANLRNLKENLSDFLVAARTGGWRAIRGPYLEKGYEYTPTLFNWYPRISQHQIWNVDMIVLVLANTLLGIGIREQYLENGHEYVWALNRYHETSEDHTCNIYRISISIKE